MVAAEMMYNYYRSQVSAEHPDDADDWQEWSDLDDDARLGWLHWTQRHREPTVATTG